VRIWFGPKGSLKCFDAESLQTWVVQQLRTPPGNVAYDYLYRQKLSDAQIDFILAHPALTEVKRSELKVAAPVEPEFVIPPEEQDGGADADIQMQEEDEGELVPPPPQVAIPRAVANTSMLLRLRQAAEDIKHGEEVKNEVVNAVINDLVRVYRYDVIIANEINATLPYYWINTLWRVVLEQINGYGAETPDEYLGHLYRFLARLLVRFILQLHEMRQEVDTEADEYEQEQLAEEPIDPSDPIAGTLLKYDYSYGDASQSEQVRRSEFMRLWAAIKAASDSSALPIDQERIHFVMSVLAYATPETYYLEDLQQSARVIGWFKNQMPTNAAAADTTSSLFFVI